jgi:hypothetical protein
MAMGMIVERNWNEKKPNAKIELWMLLKLVEGPIGRTTPYSSLDSMAF